MDIGQCADNMCMSQHDGHQLLLQQQDTDCYEEHGAWQGGGLACEFGGKSGQKGGRFQGTCDYCGKVGHRWRQCWEWQAAQGVLPGYGPLRGKAVGKGQKGKSGAKGVYSDKGGPPRAPRRAGTTTGTATTSVARTTAVMTSTSVARARATVEKATRTSFVRRWTCLQNVLSRCAAWSRA